MPVSSVQSRTATSTPTSELREGDRGNQVLLLQKALVKLGFLKSSDLNTGPGIFGPHTDEALRHFQKAKGCVVDGFYGAQSKQALQKALAGTAKPPPPKPAPAAGGPSLKLGSKGQAVKDLQALLGRAGFDPGPVDGAFGPRTRSAVIGFQRKHSLPANGAVHDDTWKALRGHKAEAPAAPPAPSTTGEPKHDS